MYPRRGGAPNPEKYAPEWGPETRKIRPRMGPEPENWATGGVCPEGVGREGEEGGQHFAPPQFFFLSSLSWVSSRGILAQGSSFVCSILAVRERVRSFFCRVVSVSCLTQIPSVISVFIGRRGWKSFRAPAGWVQFIRGPRPPSMRWPRARQVRQSAEQSQLTMQVRSPKIQVKMSGIRSIVDPNVKYGREGTRVEAGDSSGRHGRNGRSRGRVSARGSQTCTKHSREPFLTFRIKSANHFWRSWMQNGHKISEHRDVQEAVGRIEGGRSAAIKRVGAQLQAHIDTLFFSATKEVVRCDKSGAS